MTIYPEWFGVNQIFRATKPNKPEETEMKKLIVTLLFVLYGAMMTACIEDGVMPPKETPDATPPSPDGANTPDAAVPLPDVPSPVDAGVDCPPDAPPSQCTGNEDCSDGRNWTEDACNTSTGGCVHWVTDCGGMQVRPANNAATCQFWGGFGVPEPAPLLATTAPSSLPTGPSGGNWKAAPVHACSVICYGPGADGETTVDIQIEWNGLTFQHQEITGLKKGTWDGQNLRY